MLNLTRQEGQSIRIGSDITITYLGAEKGNAKFSISAPKEVRIYRKELWERISAEQSSAEMPTKLED